MPALHLSNNKDDGGGSAFFTSVSVPLTAELVEKLMNYCTNSLFRWLESAESFGRSLPGDQGGDE